MFRNSKFEKAAIREMKVLETIDKSGIRVPKVYEYIHMENKPGFIMEQIDGSNVISIVEKKPYLMIRMAKIFGRLHAEIHEIDAPVELPLLKEDLKNSIKSVHCLPDEIFEYTLELLRELPDGNRICHGDYNPSNVILSYRKPVFIDWGGV